MGAVFQDHYFQAALRAGLAILLIIGALFIVQKAWLVFEPLIVAVVFAGALWPWVTRIATHPLGPRHWRLPRVAAAGLIYAGTFVSAIVLTWMTLAAAVPQIDKLVQTYPNETAPVRAYLEPFRSGDVVGGAAKVAGDVAREAASAGQQAADGSAQPAAEEVALPVNISAFAVGLFGGVATLVLVLIFTFFLLLDGDRFVGWLLMLLPKERRLRTRFVGQVIRDRVSRWVLAVVIYAGINAVLITTFMFLIRMPTPWLYGIAAIFFSIAPGLGPVTSLIFAFVVSLGESTWQPIAIVVFAAILHALDNAILLPRIFGQVMRLPSLMVLLAALLGATLMGAWGAMISAPAAVAVEILVREGLGRDVESTAE